MLILFDIIIVIVTLTITFKLFSNSLINKIDDRERNILLWIGIFGTFFKLCIIAVWFWQVKVATDNIWLDTYSYNWGGRYLAENIRQWVFYPANFNELTKGSPGYYYFVGLIYALFGYNQWMVSIFNNLAGVWLAMITYHITSQIFGHKTGKYAFIFTLFFPLFIYWGYFILKELLVVLLVVAILWCVVQFTEEKVTKGSIFIFLFSLWILLLIRPQYTIVLLFISFFHMIICRRSNIRFRNIILSMCLLFLFIPVIYLTQPRGMPGLSALQAPIMFTSTYHTDVPDLFLGCSLKDPVGIWGRILAHPMSFIRHSLESIFRTFWISTELYSRHGPHFYQALIDLSGIYMIPLMPLAIWGGVHSWRYKKNETFIFLTFMAIMVIGVIFSGYPGRVSLSIMPIVFMFSGVGCAHFKEMKLFYILSILMFNLLIAANVTMYEGFIVALPLAILTILGVSIGLIRYRK